VKLGQQTAATGAKIGGLFADFGTATTAAIGVANTLASRIVGESLDDQARQSRVVDRFLDEIEAQATPASAQSGASA